MKDEDFGNRAQAPTLGELRASIDRSIAEMHRQAGLPAGHPEVLRAFMAGAPRLIVPSTMTAEQTDELVELAREGLVAELSIVSADREARWCIVCGQLARDEAVRGDTQPMCSACEADAAEMGEGAS